jgi:hypothetical protein
MVYMLSTIIIWVYVLINYVQSVDANRTDEKLVRLIVISLIAPLIIGIGVELCRRYITSNHLIFYTVGANLELQKMFSMLLIHDSILKFDVQMGGSVLILWIQNSFIEPQVDKTEMAVIVTGIVITVLWVGLAYLAIRLENTNLVYIFYASSWMEPALILFNFFRIPHNNLASKSLVVSAYACGVIGLISRGLSIYTMYIVSKNFGKGLKAKSKFLSFISCQFQHVYDYFLAHFQFSRQLWRNLIQTISSQHEFGERMACTMSATDSIIFTVVRTL